MSSTHAGIQHIHKAGEMYTHQVIYVEAITPFATYMFADSCKMDVSSVFQASNLRAMSSDVGTGLSNCSSKLHCCNVAILGTVDTFGTEELLLDHKKSLGATSCQLPQFEKLGIILIEKNMF